MNFFKHSCTRNEYGRYFSFKWSFSLCTYIPRMIVMLDFICMTPVDLPATHRKQKKKQNGKFSLPVGPYCTLYTCTSHSNVYICISSRMMRWILFCFVNLLFCVTFRNIHCNNIVQIAKRHTRSVFTLTCKTRSSYLILCQY